MTAEQPIAARYMDGQTARVRDVTVHLNLAARADDATLTLRDEGRILEQWRLPELRAKKDQAGRGMVLTTRDLPDARLSFDDPDMIATLKKNCPDLDRRDVAPGTYRRILLWAGGAISAVLLIVFVIVPALSDQLAELIPVESEQKLGEASVKQISWVLGQMGDKEPKFCSTPEGDAALSKMVNRLSGQFSAHIPITVRVLGHDMENAFAVPGGQVVLFDGLLQAAETPEEVAGVLGHEFGHVVNRDPTRLALRSAGTVGILGLILGDFSGGALALIVAERLVSAQYAQDAETAADVFAYEVLAGGELPSAPFANFFERMAKIVGDDTGLMSHLASHPNLTLRAENARAADTIRKRSFQRVLTPEEWSALQNICD